MQQNGDEEPTDEKQNQKTLFKQLKQSPSDTKCGLLSVLVSYSIAYQLEIKNTYENAVILWENLVDNIKYLSECEI